MSNIFVSPPFDITHTLIYPTIDNKMALKLANSKEFPNLQHLLKLAESSHFKIRRAKEIIEFLSDNIIDYLKHSNEIQLFEGLRESIESSVSNIMTSNFSVKTYRHDKKKKFE